MFFVILDLLAKGIITEMNNWEEIIMNNENIKVKYSSQQKVSCSPLHLTMIEFSINFYYFVNETDNIVFKKMPINLLQY